MIEADAISTIDEEQLRDTARRLLSDKVDRRAPWGEGRADGAAALVRDMVSLGWHLLTTPAAMGGLGQAFTALAPIYEELGRALAPVSLADTMAALDVLLLDDSDAGADLLRKIVDGSARVVIAESRSAGTRVDATLPLVEWGAGATHLLLLPVDEASSGIVDLGAEGVKAASVETWDRSRSFVDLELENAACRPIHVAGSIALSLARAHKDLAVAWDCLGAARRSLDETVDYMGTRQQFGRPIGSFQALKHRAADHKVALELARALTVHASRTYSVPDSAGKDLATQARLLAAETFHAIAEDCVQMHGGIGFTWEFDCHLFLKRALMNDVLAGAPEAARDRISANVINRAIKRA